MGGYLSLGFNGYSCSKLNFLLTKCNSIVIVLCLPFIRIQRPWNLDTRVTMFCMVLYFILLSNITSLCLRSLLKILAKVSYQRMNTHVWMNRVQVIKEAPGDLPRVHQCSQVKFLPIQWDQDGLRIGHDLEILMMDSQGNFTILYPSSWSNLLCPWLACTVQIDNLLDLFFL